MTSFVAVRDSHRPLLFRARLTLVLVVMLIHSRRNPWHLHRRGKRRERR